MRVNVETDHSSIGSTCILSVFGLNFEHTSYSKNAEFVLRTCIVEGFWFNESYEVFNELLERARIATTSRRVQKPEKTLFVEDAVRHAVGFRSHGATRDVLGRGEKWKMGKRRFGGIVGGNNVTACHDV
ncbi:hypothetical protein Sjap_007623 [Stephania japonica]|uniref:Uncharacterized protein n=1 Tax=Stephania japonica TaxID=461633 RepID=A0AAP0JNJ6_9MAGN